MSLPTGHKLAHYEIVEPIGKGGMGEVYRARDTKLERDVAIKVLPDELAADAERVARFEREAKLLASLNHPNIASIYGFESNALILELVEGPTLAERIEQGPIPVDEAIAIAKQIAEALEAGHEAGVIHRDLKPANVKVREDRTVKVLDYGLAKALEGDTPSGTDAELSQSPTLTRQGTQMGVILGTAAYMSPEQAKGKRLDKRTDIFSYGCVLYEMLTGRKTFDGETAGETLAAVIKTEPEWEALPSYLSPTLHTFLTRCLEKDPKRRVRDIGDVRLAMEGVFDSVSSPQGAVSQPVGWHPSIGVAAAGALLLSVVASVAVWNLKPEAPRPVVRSSLPLPPDVSLTGTERHVFALSSDGTRLAYSANDQLYLRSMDQMEATPVRGTQGGAQGPFFSPDGLWVGFWVRGQLKKVAIRGGAPVSICDIAINPRGARWGAENTIVFGNRTGIMQVSADGGTPEVLIPITGTEEVGHGPQVLPGEKNVLFTLAVGFNWDDAQIVVHSLETGETKVLIEDGRDARYVPTGHLVYVFDGTLLAVPFDVDKLEVTGGPIPMAEGVTTAGPASGAAQFSVSDTGALIYVSGSVQREDRTLVWVDRDGREEVLAAEPRPYAYLRISPDGERVALDVRDQENDIWIWDFARETMTRLTFAPGQDMYPVWTRDGRRVAFTSERDGPRNLYWKAADGTGTVERLNESEHSELPSAFTPDGTQLVFFELAADGVLNLGVLSLEGSSEPLLATEFDERNAEISPDGRWLAYESDSSGQYEVYVRPFPSVDDGRWLISRGGGRQPLWAPDGRELFYLAPGASLMTVDVQTEPSVAYGNPEEVFAGRFSGGPFVRTYDISPDGERFLMIKESDETSSTVEFIVVLDWFEELKRRVPTNQ